MPDKFTITFPVFGLPELGGLLGRLSSDFEHCFFCGGLFSGSYPHGNGPVPPPRADPPIPHYPVYQEPPKPPPVGRRHRPNRPPFADQGIGRMTPFLHLLGDSFLCALDWFNPTRWKITRKGIEDNTPRGCHKLLEKTEGTLGEPPNPIEMGTPLSGLLNKLVKPVELGACLAEGLLEYNEANEELDMEDEGDGNVAPWRMCSNSSTEDACAACCANALGYSGASDPKLATCWGDCKKVSYTDP